MWDRDNEDQMTPVEQLVAAIEDISFDFAATDLREVEKHLAGANEQLKRIADALEILAGRSASNG